MREALGADPPGLLERLRAGEPRAFEELVTAYQHRVFGVALRMLGSRAEAEEIAQEVFLRAHRAIAEFRGEARLGTWLYAIASRLCLNRLASPERRVARGDTVLADVPASTPDAPAGPVAEASGAPTRPAVADTAAGGRRAPADRRPRGAALPRLARAAAGRAVSTAVSARSRGAAATGPRSRAGRARAEAAGAYAAAARGAGERAAEERR